jgi:hypothetical protein
MQNSTQNSDNYQPTKICKAQKRVYNPIERSLYHRKQSESVALKLHKVAGDSLLDAQDKIKRFTGRSQFAGKLAAATKQLRVAIEAIAMSCRIWTCADPSNHFTATDLVTSNGTGECFDGYGILAGCGHKLCHACVAKDGKGNRREAEYAYKTVSEKMLVNERWRFVTFTMPPIYEGIVITNKILRTAWRSFVNSEYFSETFRGSIKGIEFSMGAEQIKRYHWHIHLLALGFFIDKPELKARWTNHVERAFKKFGLVFQPKTKDGFAIVDVRDIVARVSDSSKEKTREGALSDVCKYMTKSESWRDVPAAHLLEVASIRRWSRMFSTTGVCREVLETKNNAEKALKEARKEAQSFASAEREAKRAAFRASIKTVSENLEAESEDLSSYDGLNVRFFEQDSSVAISGSSQSVKMEMRRENWRDMAPRVGLPAYFLHRAKQMTLQIIVRKSQLIEKFGFATFTDQNKKCWYSPKAADSGTFDEMLLTAESLIDIEERLDGCASGDQFDEIMGAKDETIAWIKKRLVEFGMDQGEASSEAVATFENISTRLNYMGQNLKGFIEYKHAENMAANKSSKFQSVDTDPPSSGGWSVDGYKFTPDITDEPSLDDEVDKFVGPVEQVKKYRLYNSETQSVVRACRFYPSEMERANHSLARSKQSYLKWSPAVFV